MKRIPSTLLAAGAALLLLHSSAGAADTEPKPGHVAGKVTDSAGKPVSDAQVSISGTTNAGQRADFKTQTDARGDYSQRVPDGLYRVRAWVGREYHARKYQLTLHPRDGDFKRTHDSKPGAVKDFVWKIQGLMAYEGQDEEEGGSYYGGHVGFQGGDPTNSNTPPLEFPDGTTLEITLTPDGPLLDGSAGKPVVFKGRYTQPRLNFVPYRKREIVNIPTGRYLVTARLVDAQGASSGLRVATKASGEPVIPLALTAMLEFLPYKTSSPGILSGVTGSSLYLQR